MLRLLADENFNNDILRGLLAREAPVDIVRIQDVGLLGAADPVILAWAAEAGRILLTHDVKTMRRYAYERVAEGQRMPGVFAVRRSLPLARAIEELLLAAECSEPQEWADRVLHIPL